MRVIGVLLRAQGLNAWNRIRREAGDGGAAATAIVLVVVLLVLGVPATLTFQAGANLGDRLLAGDAPAALAQWNALQALFVVVFGLLGSFRYSPAFRATDLGHLPVRPLQLLTAEIPAALVEVFPLLSVAGIACSHLGLATRVPGKLPSIVVLGLAAVLTMLGVLFGAASLIRYLVRRRLTLPLVALAVGAVVVAAQRVGLASLLRTIAPATIPWLPGSRGSIGIFADRTTSPELVAGLIVAAGGGLVLMLLAAWFHHATIALEPTTPRTVLGARSFRFSLHRVGVARLYRTQLLESLPGRVRLVAPLVLSAPIALVVWLIRWGVAHDRILPEEISSLPDQLASVPIFTILALLIVALDGNLWMNQFGWDGRGVALMFQLPVAMQSVLAGKTLGLGSYFAAQFLLGVGPLLYVSIPTFGEFIAAFAAGALALLIGCAGGHLLSARFPRALLPDGDDKVPLYLALAQSALLLGTLSVVAALAAFFRWLYPGAEPAALVVALCAAGFVYRAALPRLGARVAGWREHLLGM